MCQVPLVTCILLRYTKITVNSVYLLKDYTAWLYSFWDPYGRSLSQKQYRFDGNCLHWFVRSDRWTSKKRLHQSHAAVFSWNARTRGQSCKRRAECLCCSFVIIHTVCGQWWLYTGEVGIPCRGWCNGADFTEISTKFPEILGAQMVCTRLFYFSAHTLEPGNEAIWIMSSFPT